MPNDSNVCFKLLTWKLIAFELRGKCISIEIVKHKFVSDYNSSKTGATVFAVLLCLKAIKCPAISLVSRENESIFIGALHSVFDSDRMKNALN